jgi:hypothetical protein
MIESTIAERAAAIRRRLCEGLAGADPHHRILGRPVTYRVDDGALEITYRDVPSIADAEIAALKRLIGGECSCTVSPQTAETVMVRLVAVL